MAKKKMGKRRRHPKTVLQLPDLDQAKSAVLNSLSSADTQRGYRHAVDEFIEWYCSEPRLSFGKSVVLRYRSHLEFRRLAPVTINLRLGVVRRLAYEASDCGLLSPDLAGLSGYESRWRMSWHTNLHEFAGWRLGKLLARWPRGFRSAVAAFVERFSMDRLCLFFRFGDVQFAPNPELMRTLAARSQYSIERKIKNIVSALLRRFNRLHDSSVGRNST